MRTTPTVASGMQLATRLAAVCLGGALLAGFAFLGLYAFRAEFYAVTEVKPATLAELYPVSPTAVAVVDYDTKPGPILIPKLRNADHCGGWRIVSDGSVVADADRFLRIPLRPGIHDYVAEPRGCAIKEPAIDAVRFNLFFGYTSTFGAQNLSADQYQVNAVNLPTVLVDPIPFSRWVPDVVAASPAEAAQAREVLAAGGFDPGASTREKIEFLSGFVRRHVPSGSPPPYLDTISPWQVFLEGDRKGVGGFCRQWSLTYGYLANLVGIPTRNLFTGGGMARVDLGSHAFSESYIREEARWAYVDPTNDIAYVTDPAGGVLSGADIFMAIVNGTDRVLTARVLTAEGVAEAAFPDVGANVRYFMHRDNFLIYVGSQDGRYQMQGVGPMRYARQLYRFLFQPQQYFGYTHFVSHSWLRAGAFFTCLAFAFFAVVLGGFALTRKGRR